MKNSQEIQTGDLSAAVLAVGVGLCIFGIGVCCSESSKAVAKAFTLYTPTGPLSGKVAFGIAGWLVAWFVLGRIWSGKEIGIQKPFLWSLALMAVGLALTFPPVIDAITKG